MEYVQFEKEVLNPSTEVHYAMLSSFTGTKFPHSHDFFELFLLLGGELEYTVDMQQYILPPGSLVLVRPGERHGRKYLKKGSHINVAFSHQIATSLFSYLDKGFPAEKIMDPLEHPMVLLSKAETESVKNMLEEVGTTDMAEPEKLRTKLRILVMHIMVTYFSKKGSFSNRSENSWFDKLLQDVETNKNFIDGVDRLVEISGKTHEHLCRVFKTQLHCTPTDYINKLKLNYAANLLIHSDTNILDICLSIGLSNLSYFYQIFRNVYHLSPGQFRKKYQQLNIP